jgi:hypothetical protein
MRRTSGEVAGSSSKGDQLLEAVACVSTKGAETTKDAPVPRQCPADSTTFGDRRTPEQGMNPSLVTTTASG